jgi:MurNAc alpha-1-phosphate uridylyltransferase
MTQNLRVTTPVPGERPHKVMILAAGRGERMGALTATRPKPLLEVGERSLIAHLIERLQRAGFEDLVINHAYRGEQIVAALGDGQHLGVRIAYSKEPAGALDTGGGIYAALPLLGDAPFIVVNADVWTDFPFETLSVPEACTSHLVLVPNPPHDPRGDFALEAGRVKESSGPRLTFSGIAVYRPAFFAGCPTGRFSVVPLLRAEMARGLVSGEYHSGLWVDVGTPQRLAALNTACNAL